LPALLLRLEGLTVLVCALAVYFDQRLGWLPLVLLALAPDVSLIAFVSGPRVGAVVYDVVHTEVVPLALGAAGVIADTRWPVLVALVWLAHIGADRLFGYGLKYPTSFQDTHVQRV
jgi:Domain of unknown function (DUF4260)